jgi:predicted phage terminase large subunit-like protein
VLFRSGDDPERLRGPNLSGIWLDEASLLTEDAYRIAIGRLREAGRQGWLTATFTPKGRRHWTYETFATGRHDTALFVARTADNPFLPPTFDATVRHQYTTALAAQELEGQFLDQGGTLFQRDWFAVVEQMPALVSRVRAWDLAATPRDEKKAHDPDWTAGVLLGKDTAGTYYVLDVRRLRGSPQEVQALVLWTAAMDGTGVPIWMEQEPGSAGVTVIDHYRRLLGGYNFRGERSTGNKADRALPLAAQAEGGTVKLVRGRWNRDFLDEFEAFPFGPHDDVVDATALAFNRLTARPPVCWHTALIRPLSRSSGWLSRVGWAIASWEFEEEAARGRPRKAPGCRPGAAAEGGGQEQAIAGGEEEVEAEGMMSWA